MNERLKKLRKSLDLTQQKFADKLGVKRNTVAQWEFGINALTDQVITSICREFHVNEDWLRNGTGEMFIQKPKDVLSALAADYDLSGSDCILIEQFINIKANERKSVIHFITETARLLANSDLYEDAPDTAEEMEQKFPPVKPN